MSNQLNMYPMIEFKEGYEQYWYPKPNGGWGYGDAKKTGNGKYEINNKIYNSNSLHPFVFVDPKYANPDVHDHSFVCKIEHNQS